MCRSPAAVKYWKVKFCLFVCLSVLSICLFCLSFCSVLFVCSVCLSFLSVSCLSVSLFPPVCPPVFLFLSLFLSLSLCPFLYLSSRLSLVLSLCPSVCLSIFSVLRSVCLSVRVSVTNLGSMKKVLQQRASASEIQKMNQSGIRFRFRVGMRLSVWN
jgi:hypothetical protein